MTPDMAQYQRDENMGIGMRTTVQMRLVRFLMDMLVRIRMRYLITEPMDHLLTGCDPTVYTLLNRLMGPLRTTLSSRSQVKTGC